MKAQLMLESIGHWREHTRQWQTEEARSQKPWVAEIVSPSGHALYGLRYLKPQGNDYRQSNGKATRGVRKVFILDTGCVYRVQEQTNWKKTNRYFCRVNSLGDIEKLNEEETMTWIRKLYTKNHLA